MYFSTKWCQPCKVLKPIVQEVSMETGVPVEFVDAEDRVDIAQSFRITSVPTILLFKENQQVVRHTGNASKQQIKEIFTKN